MGDKRYAADEERFDCQNGNNDSNSNSTYDNRGTSINGYKKIITIILFFTFVCCFRAYVIDRVIVSGNSMTPTFSDGDVMWARKFNVTDLQRYQVIVADIKGQFVIKRVIGLQNETIQIIDGYVYINGVKLNYDYGYPTQIYGCASDEVLLGENEYFLMGDNRDESLDCRIWGAVNIESIKGVVIFKFFPFWEIGFLE